MRQKFINSETGLFNIDGSKAKQRIIDLTFILSISLVVSAIIYFFAANWSGIDRETKVALVIVLVVGFHIIGVSGLKWKSERPLVGNLFLFSGTVSFGVAVALIGQMYNSHADSYVLFLIWLVPTFFMALITRFYPYDILTYILVHVTIFLYLFPSTYYLYRSDEFMIIALMLLSLANVGLFYWLNKKNHLSRVLSVGSFLMFHGIWFSLTLRSLFEQYEIILNAGYIFVLISTLYFFLTMWKKKLYIVLTISFIALYLLRWLFRLMFEINTSFIFVLIFLFAILLLYGNVRIIRWLREKMKIQDDLAMEKPWWQRLLTGVISITSALLATAAFVGFTSLVFQEIISSFYVGLALVILWIVIWKHDRLNETVMQMLIFVGLLLSVVFSWDLHWILIGAVIATIPFVWFRVNSLAAGSFVLLMMNLFIIISFLQASFDVEQLLLSLVFLHSFIAFYSHRSLIERKMFSLFINGLFYALLFSFILTFFNDLSVWTYYIYNGLFFLISTYLAYHFFKQKRTIETSLMLTFWFSFLFYKYYDFVWLLIHKSVVLSITGVIFFAVAIYFDRKNQFSKLVKRKIAVKEMVLISVVLLLQVGFVCYQYIENETALAKGEVVKLEVMPVDPRSLMQGDYINLNYEISQQEEWKDAFEPGQNVQIVLSKNEKGIHEYTGVYKTGEEYNVDYQKSANDVLINGKATGWDTIIYGIETFYIEEGTGAELEQNLQTATVSVSTTGNAILKRVE